LQIHPAVLPDSNPALLPQSLVCENEREQRKSRGRVIMFFMVVVLALSIVHSKVRVEISTLKYVHCHISIYTSYKM
jgi:hypothetical protein